jgi:hypothetical protein
MVTPVAAAIERAKAQLEREEEDFYKEPAEGRINNKRKRVNMVMIQKQRPSLEQ